MIIIMIRYNNFFLYTCCHHFVIDCYFNFFLMFILLCFSFGDNVQPVTLLRWVIIIFQRCLWSKEALFHSITISYQCRTWLLDGAHCQFKHKFSLTHSLKIKTYLTSYATCPFALLFHLAQGQRFTRNQRAGLLSQLAEHEQQLFLASPKSACAFWGRPVFALRLPWTKR